MTHWIWLAIAIIFEVAGTSCLKFSNGLTKLFPSILTFLLYGISFTNLAFALTKMEVGVAYAIWSGLGIAIITLIGFFFFNESLSLIKVLSIGLIILGVVSLHLFAE